MKVFVWNEDFLHTCMLSMSNLNICFERKRERQKINKKVEEYKKLAEDDDDEHSKEFWDGIWEEKKTKFDVCMRKMKIGRLVND